VGGGFALGFGVGGGFGFVLELIGEAGRREGFGFGFEEGLTGGVDAFEAMAGGREGFGLEGGCEFG